MSNRWQLQGSWVISKITGNYNNTSNAGQQRDRVQRSEHRPSLPALPRGPADQRQHAHRQGARHVPGAVGHHDVARVLLHDGADVHPTVQRSPSIPQGRQDLFIEPRGSQRYDDQPQARLQAREAVPFRSRSTARRHVRRVQPLQRRGDHDPHDPLRQRRISSPLAWSARDATVSARSIASNPLCQTGPRTLRCGALFCVRRRSSVSGLRSHRPGTRDRRPETRYKIRPCPSHSRRGQSRARSRNCGD